MHVSIQVSTLTPFYAHACRHVHTDVYAHHSALVFTHVLHMSLHMSYPSLYACLHTCANIYTHVHTRVHSNVQNQGTCAEYCGTRGDRCTVACDTSGSCACDESRWDVLECTREIFTKVCIDTCMDVCTDMRIHVCTAMCVDSCIDGSRHDTGVFA